ncbi:MAG: PCC domain-containing protein [Aulosira sp. ZfuVER01]|nr:DUF296 domain-containing protein [Aulosira sp. ZfuVER01]MDZ8002089.1 DUF296 domain-containing protein [Aulosira sp. DedVER01a]MDZ8052644.1 DUF296 domain-containing protein [Aulosira sp. ZfuCHP01]
MKLFAIRLKPNEYLKQSLKNFAIQKNIQAGFILSAIGSFKRKGTQRDAQSSAENI